MQVENFLLSVLGVAYRKGTGDASTWDQLR